MPTDKPIKKIKWSQDDELKRLTKYANEIYKPVKLEFDNYIDDPQGQPLLGFNMSSDYSQVFLKYQHRQSF